MTKSMLLDSKQRPAPESNRGVARGLVPGPHVSSMAVSVWLILGAIACFLMSKKIFLSSGFSWYSYLRSSLGYNQLTALPGGLFQGLTSLQEL